MKCSGCGLEIELGDAGCQELFEELTAREFMDYRYGRFHRLAVDAYCLQHPDRYCKSGKSLMAHLGGLACAFEYAGDSRAYAALQRSLNGNIMVEKPALPGFRGEVTIDEARRAQDAESYGRQVDRWARSVWQAHSSLHHVARDWLEKALSSQR